MVFWFEHYDEVSSTWFVHVAVAPEHHAGRWPVRRWLRFIAEYVASQGGTELGFVCGTEETDAERYLRRLGWRETEFGLCRPVGRFAAEAA